MKKIMILATGGTIAGSGVSGKTTGYAPGILGIQSVIREVPEMWALADICAEQITNKNSDDISLQDWSKLVSRINQLSNEDIDGFVITHGTDTLEETAYFLNLVIKTNKPVVLTGSMRPSTAISPDGPFNLYQAVALAVSEEAIGKGVLVCFSDAIYGARDVQKQSTFHLNAFSSGDFGCLGFLRDNQVYFYTLPTKKHTLESVFSIEDICHLPRVSIVYFHIDADPQVLSDALTNSDGVVIAGAGNGEFSLLWADILRETQYAHKPVVISSRIDGSIVTENDKLPTNCLSGDTLNPQKARILLLLALSKTKDIAQIREFFRVY